MIFALIYMGALVPITLTSQTSTHLDFKEGRAKSGPAAHVLEEANLGVLGGAHRVAVVLCHDGPLPVFRRVALVKVQGNQISEELPGAGGGGIM